MDDEGEVDVGEGVVGDEHGERLDPSVHAVLVRRVQHVDQGGLSKPNIRADRRKRWKGDGIGECICKLDHRA